MNYIEKIKRLFDLGDTGKGGFDEEAVVQIGTRLNITLPATFKTYYLALSKNERLTRASV